MKALTVWQPWATLIALGAKPYEFRSWQPPTSLIGHRLAIHAGARPVRASECAALIKALKGENGAVNPCLHKDSAANRFRPPWKGESVESFMAGATIAVDVGKKRAGRLLDGAEHNGMPGVQR